jgi:hypothetical protein
MSNKNNTTRFYPLDYLADIFMSRIALPYFSTPPSGSSSGGR